jgi:hypothetical protein
MAAITDWKCVMTIVVLLNLITVTTEDTNMKTFNVTCDPGPYYKDQSCQNNTTLIGIAASVKKQSHIQINVNIVIPVLHLNDTVRFSNLKYLSIVSKFGSTAIMCPASSNATAGIILSNITDTIILKNLNLIVPLWIKS